MSLGVIVLCAGQGTRMKSKLPKVIHSLCGKPLCAWPIDAALKVKPSQVIIVTGHGAEQVEESVEKYYLINKSKYKFDFVLQKNQNGTGHAVKLALKKLKSNISQVLILYGDTPFLETKSIRKLITLNSKSSPMAMLTATVSDPTGYGRIVRENKKILNITEHKDANFQEKKICEVNPGYYVFKSKFLKDNISKIKKSPTTGEYYLTDLISKASRISDIPSALISEIEMQGINNRQQLAEASDILRTQINKEHMLGGVTMREPGSVHIDDSVKIGQDVYLSKDVMLLGETKIGSDVAIGAGCIIQDSIVESGARIHPYSICDNAKIAGNTDIGPFARLRPGSEICGGAKVGNFVEVKNSTLKTGAKAGHLAYIGDSEIGESSNIGAGTITCNYDGKNKNRTIIGEKVFIGSNSTLVAPVKISEGAYVAAGSVVTEDAEKDDLVLGRSRQVVKKKYALEIRRQLNREQ